MINVKSRTRETYLITIICADNATQNTPKFVRPIYHSAIHPKHLEIFWITISRSFINDVSSNFYDPLPLPFVPLFYLIGNLPPLPFMDGPLAHWLRLNYCTSKSGGICSYGFHIKWIIGTQGNWKNQNPGGRFGATC